MEIIEILKTSIFCVFLFFLLNHAPIFDLPRSALYQFLDKNGGSKDLKGLIFRKLKYMCGCIFCLTFWYCMVFNFKYSIYCPVLSTIINNLFLTSFQHRRN